MSRRRLLAGAGVASAALVAGAGVDPVAAGTPPPASGSSAIPFDGDRQAGITTPEQSRMVFATYDVTTEDVAELAGLLVEWTRASSLLTAGKQLRGPGGQFAPPPDTGEALGLPPSQLTLTFGFGPSLFDSRFGLGRRRPAALVDLPAFPNDDLEPSRCGGDLCIQACANDAQVAFHAVRDLTRLAFGTATIRALQSGFGRTASAGAGRQTPRNLLGFHDGTANLDIGDGEAMDKFVWVDHDSDQPWMVGGTYLVSRRIRIHVEEWDRSTLQDQEQTIGRVKANGAPLGGTRESDPVDLAAVGLDGQPVIPDTAHIRLAAPTSNGGQAILRRGYSFADGVDPLSGELDAGLFFICFQKDPRLQFIPIQSRLSQIDALAEYLVHTGSGIFACPPGVSGDRTYGDGLL
ncbi:MAG: iron uptake transporter deferrochelatase/peroxidase subunit [Acidimicrobiales bacterium]|jgi:deferrochelatase/peroxidase EfeB